MMNKGALKEFAVYARKELRAQVALRAQAFSVTPEGTPDLQIGSDYAEINGNLYEDKRPLEILINEYKSKGYDQLIEEVAYTWFNRIIAIRYMELHNYLPSRVRVLSSETEGKVDPDILTDYRYADLPIDEGKIAGLLQVGKREKAYRNLLIAQCNQLSEIMPFLFEKINDYTELLLPEHLLHSDSLINKLVNDEDLTESFKDVEVIGWLYQYYIAEKKEQVGGLRNTVVKKEDLPFVTQLFTPKWIVQYMVQNSLGKLYHDLNPQTKIKTGWEYYLHSKQENVHIPKGLTLEKIKFMDPACGSGHILVYAFELFYDMYEEAGYPAREIPKLILANNLYGLDIDKRAIQMASFALMMKAQEKHRRFLKNASNIELNVYEFKDSQEISCEALNFICDNKQEKNELQKIIDEFDNAKQFGSLIMASKIDFNYYIKKIKDLNIENYKVDQQGYINELKFMLMPVLQQAKILSIKYEVVVTNPPYHNKYNNTLKHFMQKFYKEYKSDLYSAFIYRCINMTVNNGYAALMSPFTWMFISNHEKLRQYIIKNQSISSLIQLEYSAFSEATVPICTFVIQNQKNIPIGEYVRLTDFRGDEQQSIKVKESILNPNVYYRYQFCSKDFEDIPGSPIAFWASEKMRKIFRNNSKLGNLAKPRQGLATANNNKFLRLWHEVQFCDISFSCVDNDDALKSKKKWFPYNKGGSYRKWYGNQEYVINWYNDGEEIKKNKGAVIRNPSYYFKEGITWSRTTSKYLSVRLQEKGTIFDCEGCFLTLNEKVKDIYLMALMNSKVCFNIIAQINPTLHFQVGDIKKIPIKMNITEEIINKVYTCIDITKKDWDTFEVSYNFKKHPFIIYKNKEKRLMSVYDNWSSYTYKQFYTLKKQEEELNEIFIEMYELQNELTPEVVDEEITVSLAEKERDVKLFLSYVVGCILGRYSLDVEGLCFAGGEWNDSLYETFIPDKDAIIPLTDVAYFEDDIITRLQQFLRVTFGENTLHENIQWIAESLNMKNNETPLERLRRYFFEEFYKDHVNTYQKRPIYWLVDSGKNKGFRALIYLHRYTPDTLATLRFNYLHEIQGKYSQEISRLENMLSNTQLSATEKKKTQKQMDNIRKRQQELIEFDKILADYANQRISLDLDDGVAHNYKKLQGILAKI